LLQQAVAAATMQLRLDRFKLQGLDAATDQAASGAHGLNDPAARIDVDAALQQGDAVSIVDDDGGSEGAMDAEDLQDATLDRLAELDIATHAEETVRWHAEVDAPEVGGDIPEDDHGGSADIDALEDAATENSLAAAEALVAMAAQRRDCWPHLAHYCTVGTLAEACKPEQRSKIIAKVSVNSWTQMLTGFELQDLLPETWLSDAIICAGSIGLQVLFATVWIHVRQVLVIDTLAELSGHGFAHVAEQAVAVMAWRKLSPSV
jgi:hypothetical protein